MIAPLVLAFPFTGRWMAQNSPANRVPSHGTTLFGTTYAIDFVCVDDRGRTAPRSWRSAFGTEAAEIFRGFGADVTAPLAGTIVAVHDGEEDHVSRRSPLALAGYALTQGSRVRQGAGAIAGNHVVIAAAPSGPFLLVAHLQRGSVAVRAGDVVRVGDRLGGCGNSGNSTEPHVHLQAMDAADAAVARGLPIAFSAPGAPALPRNGEPFTV
ncbi:MAG: M23 family metallopeptidase [Microbacterium sp.]